jgi:hypothetical protein
MWIYDEKPWLSLYDPDQPAEISLEFTDALSMFRAAAARNPDGDAIRYVGGRITARELDELSDAFAAALLDLGVQPGDRVALYLQNVPRQAPAPRAPRPQLAWPIQPRPPVPARARVRARPSPPAPAPEPARPRPRPPVRARARPSAA